MLQYVAPVMHFVIGVAVLGERMPPARWAGFALVWVALAILTVDGLRAGRSARRVAAGGGAVSGTDGPGRPRRRP